MTAKIRFSHIACENIISKFSGENMKKNENQIVADYINLHRLFYKLMAQLPTTDQTTYDNILSASQKFACVRNKYEQKLGANITNSKKYLLLKQELTDAIKCENNLIKNINENKNEIISLLNNQFEKYEKIINN